MTVIKDIRVSLKQAESSACCPVANTYKESCMNQEIKCEICGRGFGKKIQLFNHIRSAHKFTSQRYYDQYLKKEGEGLCLNCGKPTGYRTLTIGYGKFCSQKCLANSDYRKHKTVETSLRKYGTNSPNQSDIVKQNKIKAVKELYGKDHFFQTKRFKKKLKNALLSKYGVEHALQNPELLQKSQETCLKHHGVRWSPQSESVKQKSRATRLLRYGSETFVNKLKYKQTCIERYGVDNPSKNKEILKKIFKKLKSHKTYKLPSGKIVHLMGYETNFLDYVFKNNILKEDDINYSPKGIKYQFQNKEHYYFPDFYIPKYNLFVECKSDYVLKLQGGWKIQNAKCSAVEDEGYNYVLILNNDYTPLFETIKV